MNCLKARLKRKTPKKFDAKVDEKCVEKIFLEISSQIIGKIGQGDLGKFIIRDGALYIRTPSSSIASELWRNREKIKRKINEAIGDEVVVKIKIN